jgi:hypothetical protein
MIPIMYEIAYKATEYYLSKYGKWEIFKRTTNNLLR